MTDGTKGSRTLVFKTDERVTLPVFDEKTQKKMLLTLQPGAAVVAGDQGATQTLIQHGDRQWYVHDHGQVTPLSGLGTSGKVALISLSVIGVTPVP